LLQNKLVNYYLKNHKMERQIAHAGFRKRQINLLLHSS
jgi:hypothetical protein